MSVNITLNIAVTKYVIKSFLYIIIINQLTLVLTQSRMMSVCPSVCLSDGNMLFGIHGKKIENK